MVSLSLGLGLRRHFKATSGYLAYDDFNRTIATGVGWGTSDSGHAWAVSNLTYCGVGSGAGYCEPTVGNSVSGNRLGYAGGGDQDVLALVHQKLASVNYGTRVRNRAQADGAYPSKYELGWFQGSAAWGVAGGGLAFTTFSPTGGAFAAGDTWWMRLRVTGSNPVIVQGRVWKQGTSEPSSWNVDLSDATGSRLTGGRPGFVFEWAAATGGATTGAYLLSFQVSGTTASPTSPGLDPVDFGAVGNGVADDTAAWQSMVNSAAAGATIDGRSRTYLVDKVDYLRSNLTVQNCNFTKLAGGAGGDLKSPVSIGANNNTTIKSNLTFKNVHINGNRSNQTSVGGFEDGGRSGFRIIGACNDILIENCSATLCATDGLEMYSGVATRPAGYGANEPLIKRVTVRNSNFTQNRRLGGSGDSMQDCTFDTCTFNTNGNDVSGSAGTAPRQGFDLELYDAGSTNLNLSFTGCQFTGNVGSGFVGYDPRDQNMANWTFNSGLAFTNCTFNGGTSGGVGCDITSAIVFKTGVKVFRNITFSNCACTGGYTFRCCDNINMTGGSCSTTGPTAGLLDHTTNVTAERATALGGENFSTDTSTVTYV